MSFSAPVIGQSRNILLYSGAAVLVAAVCGSLVEANPAGSTTADDPPAFLQLTGVVRDFHELSHENGHSDFERQPDRGFGHFMGNIQDQLNSDGKPQFAGGGFKVTQQWTDVNGNPIFYRLADTSRGDIVGATGGTSTGGIRDAASFDQWYRDVPGVNLSRALTLTLVNDGNGKYIFDDKEDPLFRGRDGFFPIDDELFGNPGGRPDHNFHFTFELHTEFTYDASADQLFRFIGDDDVWVFIDGKLVIDIGGVHAAVEQYVDLNRLGLTDGETYTLDFFFAERHRTQSNFRIETNLKLENTGLPTITGGYD